MISLDTNSSLMSLEVTLPYPPSVNSYWHHKRSKTGVQTFLSKRALEFRNAVLCKIHDIRFNSKIKPYDLIFEEKPLQMEVFLYNSDKRHRDIDNGLKSLLDALQHANVYKDDFLICKLTVWRITGANCAQCLVKLSYLKKDGYT